MWCVSQAPISLPTISCLYFHFSLNQKIYLFQSCVGHDTSTLRQVQLLAAGRKTSNSKVLKQPRVEMLFSFFVRTIGDRTKAPAYSSPDLFPYQFPLIFSLCT